MNQHDLLAQLGRRSDATGQQLHNHWIYCPHCHPNDCPVGQHLAQAAWAAFKAWDDLDTQLNFPELVKKDGAA